MPTRARLAHPVATAVLAAGLLGACATSSPPSATPEADTASGPVQKVVHDGHAGEVRGTAAPGSKFAQLRMGMGMKEVAKLLGQPTHKFSYITGKGFYTVGGDTYRQEFRYKGLGRLTFASNGGLSLESHLIRIIHDAEEKGTRS